MTKEKMADELAEKIYNDWVNDDQEHLEDMILETLTSILHNDKGTLTKGTII